MSESGDREELDRLLGEEFGERLAQMLQAWRAETAGPDSGRRYDLDEVLAEAGIEASGDDEEPAVRMWRETMNHASPRLGEEYTSLLIELFTLVLNLLDVLGRLAMALIGTLLRLLGSFPWKGSKP